MNLPGRHPDGFAGFQSLRVIFSFIWGFTMMMMKVMMMMMKNDKADLCSWRRKTAQQPLSAGKAEESSKKTEASSPSVLASPSSLLSPSSCCFSAFPSKSSTARWLCFRSLASRLLRCEQEVAALDKLMRR